MQPGCGSSQLDDEIDRGFDFIGSAVQAQTPTAERDAKEVRRHYQSKMRRESAHQKKNALRKRKNFLDFEYERQRYALLLQKSAAGSDEIAAAAKTANLNQQTKNLAKVLEPLQEKLVVMQIAHKSERESFRVSSEACPCLLCG